jgi:hypothetical protein
MRSVIKLAVSVTGRFVLRYETGRIYTFLSLCQGPIKIKLCAKWDIIGRTPKHHHVLND